ncbi:MAG: DnaJ domain-containing protein, partial [Candidatus Omnitrophica bacterium]|nr:DnaJ domain-containing protein [Candidatus Omnitrophota bacterium]
LLDKPIELTIVADVDARASRAEVRSKSKSYIRVNIPDFRAIQQSRHLGFSDALGEKKSEQSTVPNDSALLKQLGIKPGETIWGFAAYFGNWLGALKTSGAQVIYTDIDPKIVDWVKKHKRSEFFDPVIKEPIRLGDPMTEPTNPNEIDWTFSYEPLPVYPFEWPWIIQRALLNRKGLITVSSIGTTSDENEWLKIMKDLYGMSGEVEIGEWNGIFRLPQKTKENMTRYMANVKVKGSHQVPLLVTVIKTDKRLKRLALLDIQILRLLQKIQFRNFDELKISLFELGISRTDEELQKSLSRISILASNLPSNLRKEIILPHSRAHNIEVDKKASSEARRAEVRADGYSPLPEWFSNPKATYYNILGVDPFADMHIIKKAYRYLVLQWHPDRNKTPQADPVFKKITEAYEVLSDSQNRATYDRMMKVGGQRANYGDEDLEDLWADFMESHFGAARSVSQHNVSNYWGPQRISSFSWGRNGEFYLGLINPFDKERAAWMAVLDPRDRLKLSQTNDPIESEWSWGNTVYIGSYGTVLQISANPVDDRVAAILQPTLSSGETYLVIFRWKEMMENAKTRYASRFKTADDLKSARFKWAEELTYLDYLVFPRAPFMGGPKFSWSFDGKKIVVIGTDGTIIDWDLEQKIYRKSQIPLKMSWAPSDYPTVDLSSTNMSPGGIFAAVSYPSGIWPSRESGRTKPFFEVWDVASKKSLARLDRAIRNYVWDGDGNLILAFEDDPSIYRWHWSEKADLEKIAEMQGDPFSHHFQVSPDGSFLVIGEGGSQLHVLDLKTLEMTLGTPIAGFRIGYEISYDKTPLETARPIDDFAWSPDGSAIATSYEGRLTIWNLGTAFRQSIGLNGRKTLQIAETVRRKGGSAAKRNIPSRAEVRQRNTGVDYLKQRQYLDGTFSKAGLKQQLNELMMKDETIQALGIYESDDFEQLVWFSRSPDQNREKQIEEALQNIGDEKGARYKLMTAYYHSAQYHAQGSIILIVPRSHYEAMLTFIIDAAESGSLERAIEQFNAGEGELFDEDDFKGDAASDDELASQIISGHGAQSAASEKEILRLIDDGQYEKAVPLARRASPMIIGKLPTLLVQAKGYEESIKAFEALHTAGLEDPIAFMLLFGVTNLMLTSGNPSNEDLIGIANKGDLHALAVMDALGHHLSVGVLAREVFFNKDDQRYLKKVLRSLKKQSYVRNGQYNDVIKAIETKLNLRSEVRSQQKAISVSHPNRGGIRERKLELEGRKLKSRVLYHHQHRGRVHESPVSLILESIAQQQNNRSELRNQLSKRLMWIAAAWSLVMLAVAIFTSKRGPELNPTPTTQPSNGDQGVQNKSTSQPSTKPNQKRFDPSDLLPENKPKQPTLARNMNAPKSELSRAEAVRLGPDGPRLGRGPERSRRAEVRFNLPEIKDAVRTLYTYLSLEREWHTILDQIPANPIVVVLSRPESDYPYKNSEWLYPGHVYVALQHLKPSKILIVASSHRPGPGLKRIQDELVRGNAALSSKILTAEADESKDTAEIVETVTKILARENITPSDIVLLGQPIDLRLLKNIFESEWQGLAQKSGLASPPPIFHTYELNTMGLNLDYDYWPSMVDQIDKMIERGAVPKYILQARDIIKSSAVHIPQKERDMIKSLLKRSERVSKSMESMEIQPTVVRRHRRRPIEIDLHLAEEFARIRTLLNMTQAKFGAALNHPISGLTVSLMERGKKKIPEFILEDSRRLLAYRAEVRQAGWPGTASALLATQAKSELRNEIKDSSAPHHDFQLREGKWPRLRSQKTFDIVNQLLLPISLGFLGFSSLEGKGGAGFQPRDEFAYRLSFGWFEAALGKSAENWRRQRRSRMERFQEIFDRSIAQDTFQSLISRGRALLSLPFGRPEIGLIRARPDKKSEMDHFFQLRRSQSFQNGINVAGFHNGTNPTIIPQVSQPTRTSPRAEAVRLGPDGPRSGRRPERSRRAEVRYSENRINASIHQSAPQSSRARSRRSAARAEVRNEAIDEKEFIHTLQKEGKFEGGVKLYSSNFMRRDRAFNVPGWGGPLILEGNHWKLFAKIDGDVLFAVEAYHGTDFLFLEDPTFMRVTVRRWDPSKPAFDEGSIITDHYVDPFLFTLLDTMGLMGSSLLDVINTEAPPMIDRMIKTYRETRDIHQTLGIFLVFEARGTEAAARVFIQAGISSQDVEKKAKRYEDGDFQIGFEENHYLELLVQSVMRRNATGFAQFSLPSVQLTESDVKFGPSAAREPMKNIAQGPGAIFLDEVAKRMRQLEQTSDAKGRAEARQAARLGTAPSLALTAPMAELRTKETSGGNAFLGNGQFPIVSQRLQTRSRSRELLSSILPPLVPPLPKDPSKSLSQILRSLQDAIGGPFLGRTLRLPRQPAGPMQRFGRTWTTKVFELLSGTSSLPMHVNGIFGISQVFIDYPSIIEAHHPSSFRSKISRAEARKSIPVHTINSIDELRSIKSVPPFIG